MLHQMDCDFVLKVESAKIVILKEYCYIVIPHVKLSQKFYIAEKSIVYLSFFNRTLWRFMFFIVVF